MTSQLSAQSLAPALSIVVPVMNERDSVGELTRRITEACRDGGLGPTELIFVDDGSSDDTWDVLQDLATCTPGLRALRLRRNRGKTEALKIGIAAARADVLVTMDGDLQDDPAELPKFIAALNQGYDLVCGWKRQRHDPPSKRYPSKLFNLVTARVSGLPLHDFNCGFKAFRREAWNAIRLSGELHRYIAVLVAHQGYRVTEIVVRHHPRRHGASKFGARRYIRGFLDLLTVLLLTRWVARPGHLFGGLGVVISALGGAALAYLVALKLVTGAAIGQRPLLMLSVLACIVGVQFLVFGLLAELINFRGPESNSAEIVSDRAGGSDGVLSAEAAAGEPQPQALGLTRAS